MFSLILSACSTVDYGTRRENFDKQTRRGDNLAFVSFASDDNDLDPYAVHLNRDKLRRGYAIQAPISSVEDKVRTHFTISKTKEYKWFSGLQLSYEF